MPKVVSNSTPIIHLTKMGYLNLLEKLYGNIYITNDVYEECTSFTSLSGEIKEEIESIKTAPFLIVESVVSSQLVRVFSQLIDQGEASAIALAIESNANLILLDDSEARNVAGIYKLNCTGTIGILLKARKNELISGSVAELLNNLKNTGFYLSSRLEKFLIENF